MPTFIDNIAREAVHTLLGVGTDASQGAHTGLPCRYARAGEALPTDPNIRAALADKTLRPMEAGSIDAGAGMVETTTQRVYWLTIPLDNSGAGGDVANGAATLVRSGDQAAFDAADLPGYEADDDDLVRFAVGRILSVCPGAYVVAEATR